MPAVPAPPWSGWSGGPRASAVLGAAPDDAFNGRDDGALRPSLRSLTLVTRPTVWPTSQGRRPGMEAERTGAVAGPPHVVPPIAAGV